MNASEIQALIDEYNAAEEAQQARLVTLYREMRDRNGSLRHIAFSDGTRWTTNAFQPAPEALSLPRFVGEKVRMITSVDLGQDGDGTHGDEAGVMRFVKK